MPPKISCRGRSGTSISPMCLPVLRVDENLPIGDVDVAVRVHGDAFASALRKGLQFREGPVRFHLAL